MDYEKQYVNYLIENVEDINTDVLDDYFLDRADFTTLIESIGVDDDLLSFNTFVKSKKIDDLLD
jgi:hypothetical protein